MDWILWIVVGLMVLGGLAAISQVGKPREPITPAGAVVATVITAFYITAIIWVGILN